VFVYAFIYKNKKNHAFLYIYYYNFKFEKTIIYKTLDNREGKDHQNKI
jgi:hypothetical protein